MRRMVLAVGAVTLAIAAVIELTVGLSAPANDDSEPTADERLDGVATDEAIDPEQAEQLTDSLFADLEPPPRVGPPFQPSEAQRSGATADGEQLAAGFLPRDCDTGQGAGGSYFEPRAPAPGEVLDAEPLYDPAEVEVVHVGDMALPSGTLLESGGESLGSGGIPQPIAEPGTYRYYHLVVGEGALLTPLLGQLVIDPDDPPVRWVDDVRFGSGTDGGVNWVGSPEASIDRFAPIDQDADRVERDLSIARHEAMFWALFDELGVEDRSCVWFDVASTGATSVLFDNGWGDGWTPAAAGYGAAGDLVAITWYYGLGSWLLAGIPGEPPSPVVEEVERRRAELDDGS